MLGECGYAVLEKIGKDKEYGYIYIYISLETITIHQ